MNRWIGTMVLVAALGVGACGTARAAGPGSSADAIAAYNFFFGQLSQIYFANPADRIMKATALAADIGTAGKGAAQEATAAYTFFFAQLSQIYYANPADRIMAAVDYAVKVGKAGHGAATELTAAYTFFFGQLSQVYFANPADRMKAAMDLALKVATEGPTVLPQGAAMAVATLGLVNPLVLSRQAHWQQVLNFWLLEHRR